MVAATAAAIIVISVWFDKSIPVLGDEGDGAGNDETVGDGEGNVPKA